MAVVARVEEGVFIDHAEYVKSLYRQSLFRTRNIDLQYKEEYFAIAEQHITESALKDSSQNGKKKNRKRKLPMTSEEQLADAYHDIVSPRLKEILEKLLDEIKRTLPGHGTKCAGDFHTVDNKKNANILAQILPVVEGSQASYGTCFTKGLNFFDGVAPCVASISNERYVIPPKCTFLCSDISQLKPLLDDARTKGGYDVIVLDPPWRNKSAKRGKKYCWLTLNQIKSLPLMNLMGKNCYVFVWVTNKQKFHKFVVNELFPTHGIRFVAEWHWIKVTSAGLPVYDFSSKHKRPYETILIGIRDDSENLEAVPPLVFCSMPCSVHSHKPPLDKIIKTVFKFDTKEPKCLEMFARNLTPGWTSWGNEVLEMQNVKHFVSS